jgi:adenylosuccinate synthase
MKADVLLGLQWGDEGKGKIVDVLTPQYNIIARFQGGPNAGHTLEFNGIKHVLHTIPSGIFRKDAINIIGNGVVIDPIVLMREISSLENLGVDVYSNLKISKKAHLILPTHRILDAASEAQKGLSKIGSTLKGIGPTYMDKTGRNGLRIGDIFQTNFLEKYNNLLAKHFELIKFYNHNFEIAEAQNQWFDAIEKIKKLQIIDSEVFVNNALANGQRVLCEGAQGSLLDIDFGTYPFVTSSNTTCAGACTGLGIAPNKIENVYGIFKAYCTRVGSGPFPTELNNEIGEKMRKIGNEYGSTTGRERRCGWLDLPALKYAVMLNGVTELIMMKADVLNTFETINVCTHYSIDGELTEYFPYDATDSNINPVYETLMGWNCETNEINDLSKMPSALQQYIKYIENAVGVPITIVSLGPDRAQTLTAKNVLLKS